MSEIEEYIEILKSHIAQKQEQINELIAERNGLRAINKEYQARQQKDNETIAELLAENIELHNKLDGMGLA